VEQLAVETHHSFLASHRYFIEARPVAETPDNASQENNKKNYLTYPTKGCSVHPFGLVIGPSGL